MGYRHSVNRVSHTTRKRGCYESRINGAELLEKDCVIEAQWQRPAGLRNWKQNSSNISRASKETAKDCWH